MTGNPFKPQFSIINLVKKGTVEVLRITIQHDSKSYCASSFIKLFADLCHRNFWHALVSVQISYVWMHALLKCRDVLFKYCVHFKIRKLTITRLVSEIYIPLVSISLIWPWSVSLRY